MEFILVITFIFLVCFDSCQERHERESKRDCFQKTQREECFK